MDLAISPFFRFNLGTLLQFQPQFSVIDYDSFLGHSRPGKHVGLLMGMP